ncbi:PAS domain-containing protein [Dongia sp.]|uniref:PAS domain-containing protein n=1 Tax=Dongia sp. TaxID=1977262 RepID=UPI0035B3A58D
MTIAMAEPRNDSYFINLLGGVIASQSNETVIVTDPDIDNPLGPVIQFATAAVERTSGYTPRELVGRRLGTLFAADKFVAVLEMLREVAASKQAVIVDQEARHRTGRGHWLELSTSPVFDDAGKLIHFVRVGRDISARKTAELGRESTQRLLASVFGVINEPLAVADSAGKVVMANTAVTRRLGWSIFDLMGKPVLNCLAEADRPSLDGMMTSASALDQTRQLKCFLEVKGKQPVAGEVELTSIRQQDGNLYHVLTLRLGASKDAVDKDWTFELAVRQALSSGNQDPSVVAGKLQLVGLEAIKESLGDKWQALAERAHSLAERTIQNHLRHGDIFRRTKDDGYLVLFSHLSATEAQFKANAIAAEIKEKLLGEMPELAEARVAAFSSTVPVEQSETKNEETIVQSIERRLKAERNRVEKEARDALTHGLRSMRAISAPVLNVEGKPTPITTIHLPKSLREAVQSLHSLGEIGYELEAQTFLLAGAAEQVLAGLGHGAGKIILTQVSAETLANARMSEAWLKVARTLGDAAKSQIVVELRDIPADVAATRLTDLTMRLSSLFKSVAFELPTVDSAFLGKLPMSTKLATITLAKIPWSSTGEPSPAFCKIVKSLDLRQRRLIVREIASPAKRMALGKIGVTLFAPPE